MFNHKINKNLNKNNQIIKLSKIIKLNFNNKIKISKIRKMIKMIKKNIEIINL